MDRKLILILSMALMALGMTAQNSVEQRVNVIRQAYANRLNLMQNQPYDDDSDKIGQMTIAYNRMFPGTGLACFNNTYYWTDDNNEEYMLKPVIYFAVQRSTMNSGIYHSYREFLYDPETEEPMFMLVTTQRGDDGKRLEYRFYFDKGKLIRQTPDKIEPVGDDEVWPGIEVDNDGHANVAQLLNEFEFHRKNFHNNVDTYSWE